MEIDKEYFDKFENTLRTELLRLATDRAALGGRLLESDDITAYYSRIEANYLADAVQEIIQYPTVSVGWAAYVGMAVAYRWDTDWKTFARAPYKSLYGSQGFDNMDDHILSDILGLKLDGDEARRLVALIQSCAQVAVDAIRREQFEPQSPMAYHAFIRACRAMYAIGAALSLHRMGYKLEAIPVAPMGRA